MKNKQRRLSVLSNLEEFAFYGLPDFDHDQRHQFFTFEPQEWNLIKSRPSLHTKIFCALQMGYFKAKNTFFKFSLHKVLRDDIDFIKKQYFNNKKLSAFTITKYEYYFQQQEICKLFGYQIWSKNFLTEINDRAKMIVKRDTSPNFIANELLTYLKNKKIVRPGHTTLQNIVSNGLTHERNRLKVTLQSYLTEDHRKSLDQLYENDNTLSELASLKQDAKSFGTSMMRLERQKYHVLKPLYQIAKTIFPHLGISQQNIDHYASLAHHYSAYDLDRFEDEQTYLYLLCYVFKRYQKVNDTLVDAFDFQVKKLETDIKAKSTSNFYEEKADHQIGRLMLLYVDENLTDSLTLGETRQKAFEILPKDSIRSIAEKMMKKPQRKLEIQWKERDKAISCYKRHLRCLFIDIDFSSLIKNNPLLEVIQWMKEVFSKKQSLLQQPSNEFPDLFISKRLEPYLITMGPNGKKINANRYEILVYRQIAKQMQTGALHIEDSIRHRTFYHELVPLNEKENILKTLDIPWLKTPCEDQLDLLFKELHSLWNQFNSSLKKGNLKYFKYDHLKKEVIWTKPKEISEGEEEKQQTFYDKLPICDVADVLRYVNDECGFLSSLTPLKPRYKKQKTDEDQLIAVIIAQATGIGNYKMAQTSDISYRALETTYEQYLRLSTLKKAHDDIANAITRLSIFPYYTFDLDLLYGSFDGQKYETITPTARARYSRKYYKKGRGVVAYTLLSNHVPIQGELIGAHEHESSFAFDLWYGNTSLINPTILTGDMHSINKANFAIFYWFGGDFRPRFTNLKKEMKNIFCAKDPSHYKKVLVQPVGQIDRQLIFDQKDIINQVVASLGFKEISQSTLIKKLCSLSPQNNTRKAIFEFDKLRRSIYTLKCILNPKILSDVHRSQNRIETYHSLRAAIARAGGRKALLGRTDLEVEISNQCGRLVSTAIIYYNSAILSRLYDKTSEDDKEHKKKRKILIKTSPVAWQNVHFTGHFTFYNNKKSINIDNIIENIEL